MSTVTQSSVTIANEEQGTLAVQTQTEDGLQIKTRHGEDGETSFIEGYAATTHRDEANDVFTEQALENMAERIRNNAEETVDVVFPHFEGMDESEIGNINHNNNPAAQQLFGTDTRTVSVFRTVHAETHTLEDGETGLFIRGEMLPLPDDVKDAVKGQIEEGALHSFSIEFNPTNVNFGLQDGEPTRTILDAQPQGTALTGRPMNTEANLTNAELKNIMAKHSKDEDYKAMYKEEFKNADIYSTEEEAMSRAEELGLTGVHTHTEDGETVYMPGETHDDYVEATENNDMNSSHKDKEKYKNNVKTNEDTNMSEESNETPEEQVEEEESPEQEVTEEIKNEEGETEPEEDTSEEDVESEGEGELKSDVHELKTMFKDIKDENESLREENRELKSQLEDLKTMDGLKSEINDIKSMIEDSGEDLEGDRPITNPDEEREVKNQTQKPRWQRVIDQLGYDEQDLKTEIGKKGMTEAESIAETHGLKTQEVLDYVN